MTGRKKQDYVTEVEQSELDFSITLWWRWMNDGLIESQTVRAYLHGALTVASVYGPTELLRELGLLRELIEVWNPTHE